MKIGCVRTTVYGCILLTSALVLAAEAPLQPPTWPQNFSVAPGGAGDLRDSQSGHRVHPSERHLDRRLLDDRSDRQRRQGHSRARGPERSFS